MVLSARLVPCVLTDVQKADCAETSTSLVTLFNENPDNFISRFVTLGDTWLPHFDPESKAQSVAWKHATYPPPRKFRCSHQPAKSLPPYSGILKQFYWLTIWNIAELLQEPTTLIWLENVEQQWKRRDEESCDAECCFIRTMHLLIRHHNFKSTDCRPKCRLWTAPPTIIFARFGPQWLLFVSKTERIHERTEICWRRWYYLHCEWLAGGPRSRILLQWNTGFGESLN